MIEATWVPSPDSNPRDQWRSVRAGFQSDGRERLRLLTLCQACDSLIILNVCCVPGSVLFWVLVTQR